MESSKLKTRLPRRAHLGIVLRAQAGGLVVADVPGQSPASASALCAGDELVSVGGQRARAPSELDAAMRSLADQSGTRIAVRRNGDEVSLEVPLSPMPSEQFPSGRLELGECRGPHGRLRTLTVWPQRATDTAWMLLPGASWTSVDRPFALGSVDHALIDGLAATGVAVHRVERSGIGDSEGPACVDLDWDAEIAGFHSGLSALLAQEQVRRVVLFGVSLGGMVAPVLATTLERAKGATLDRVVAFGSSARPWMECAHGAAVRQLERQSFEEAERRQRAEQLAELEELVYVHGLTPAQAFEQYPELQGIGPPTYAGQRVAGRVASFFQQLQLVDLAACWQKLECPVLALHGSDDWISSAEEAREIAELAPAGRFQQLDGVDHAMGPARGAEKVLGALQSFFTQA